MTAIPSASFYITGGTVPRDAACYVARQADTDLLEGLRQGQFCYVLTARQMGKSSLMVRTALKLRQESVTCVILDLTAIGQNLDAERWYGGLLNQVGQQVDLEDELDDAWLAPSSLGPMQRRMKCLSEVVLKGRPGKLVLFVDEIDAVRSLPFSADEFFAGIRECYNRRTEDADYNRLAFCLLGVATPADLIRDPRTTPFNIGKRIELTDFTEAEAHPLSAGFTYMLDGEPVFLQNAESEALLKRVLYWTGGHPYLTQRLCSALAEQGPTSKRTDMLVDCLCDDLFLNSSARQRDDNLLFVRERLLRSDVDIAGLLLLYRQVWEGKRVAVEETNPLISLLRLSGIARAANGFLKPRNRIYAHVFDKRWIAANMPDADVQRQKAARRRGFMAAAIPSLIALSIVTGALIFAYSEWRLAVKRAQSERNANNLAQSKTLEAIKAKQTSDRLAADNGRLAKERGDLADRNGKLADDLKGKIGEVDDRNKKLVDAVTAQKSALFALKAEKQKSDELATKEKNARKSADTQTERSNDLAYDANMNLIQNIAENDFDTNRIREILEQSSAKQRRFEWQYWNKAFPKINSRILKGHIQRVAAVALSQDGRTVVTGSDDKTARMWDVKTGQTTLVLKGHTLPIRAVALSGDGRILVTGSVDRTARLWDVKTGRTILVLKGHTSGVGAAAISQDGRTVVTGSQDKTARIWDVKSGQTTLILKGHTAGVVAVAISQDGETLVTGDLDGTVRIWDVKTGQTTLILKGHTSGVVAVALSQDGRTIVTGSLDNTVQIWDTAEKAGNSLKAKLGHRAETGR